MDPVQPSNGATIKLVVLFTLSIAIAAVFLFFASHPKSVPILLMETVAGLGIALTMVLGWWVKKKKRLSIPLCLLVGGNLLCFTSIILPLSINLHTALLNLGFALYVLSVLSRYLMPFIKKRTGNPVIGSKTNKDRRDAP